MDVMNAIRGVTLLLAVLASGPAMAASAAEQLSNDEAAVPSQTIPAEATAQEVPPATPSAQPPSVQPPSVQPATVRPSTMDASRADHSPAATTAPSPKPAPVKAHPQPPLPPPPAGKTRGFQVIPCLGINSPFGSGSDDHWFGTSVGLLVGWKTARQLSVNAQLILDSMDNQDSSGGGKPEERYTDLTFAPLVHKETPRVIVVAGLAFGYYRRTLWKHGSVDAKESSQGLSLGLNLGIFAPLGRVALGGMFNARLHRSSRACSINTFNREETCHDRQGFSDEGGTLGLAGAVMF